ncbi:siderophore-interacting protein [Pseudoroseicyclus aestuarii]|uniref:NADPH-dependent ferric siderophore reductase n=1 Tax=Pseudoroseicyclus aestuarii TaxID=1795041 RepID=A0A318SUM9_9RHOB|nr:siderophore-interacting protein [Pseudoroseicyclus aestuarii]PYE85085.1 NADPH-dependent ferric siderophore reductase [Pseudoroseicyclus aestuarii]
MTQTPPTIRRERHELKRRHLTVTQVQRLSPAMIRVTLQGAEMADFPSPAFDDHCKLVLPQAAGEPVLREYTPRRVDRAAGRLVLDFVDHDGGPAADWARMAGPGDALTVAGPRGSQVIEGEVGSWLLIGDETALPAIGRFIEEAAAGTKVTALVAVTGPEDEQLFDTKADLDLRWLHRPLEAAADPAPLLAATGTLAPEEGRFAWIAAEAGVARALREALLEAGQPLQWMKAAGYWTQGKADTSDKAIGAG